MAIAHDASSAVAAGTTTRSWTHTPSGTPKGVLVFVVTIGNISNKISSVTYGSRTLTFVDGALDSTTEPGRVDVYFAGTDIPTGAQTVTVNRSSGSEDQWAVAVTVTAATSATDFKNPTKYEGNRFGLEAAVDDASPGANSLRYAVAYGGMASVNATTGGTTTMAPGSNSTNLQNNDFGNYVAQVVRETTAGQGSRSVGFYATDSDDWASVHLAVRESIGGTLAVTEGADTLTGTGTVATAAITGTLAKTEAADTLTGTGKVTVKGTLSKTEAADTLTSNIDAIIQGILHHTDTDTLTATGLASRSIGVLGKVMVQTDAFQTDAFQYLDDTEPGDTLSATAKAIVTGTLSKTEAADTLSASGTVGATTATGTLAKTEAADTLSGIGKVTVSATLAKTEAADTAGGTGKVTVKGTVAVTESADTATTTAKVIVTGTLAKTAAADTLTATGTVADKIATGTLARTEAADTLTGTGTVANTVHTGTLARTEAADTLAGTGKIIVSGTLGVTEAADTLVAGNVDAGPAFQTTGFQNDAFQLATADPVFQSDAFQADTFPTLGASAPSFPASAEAKGAFTTSGSFAVAASASATLSGAGSLSATGNLDLPAFAGFVQADAFQSSGSAATLYDRPASGAGQFTLTGSFTGNYSAVAALSGTGTLWAAVGADNFLTASAIIVGYGDISALAGRSREARAEADGSGSVAATARLLHTRTATLSGAGTVTAQAGLQLMFATAELVGAGAATADTLKTVLVSVPVVLQGGGVMAAATFDGSIQIGMQMAGAGAATAIANRIIRTSQNASGSGTLLVSAVAVRAARATLGGVGGMATLGKKTNRQSYPSALLIGV